MKPNCYDCIHRRDVAGSAHSRCGHPSIPTPSAMDEALAILGRPVMFSVKAGRGLSIKGNWQGVRHGWFNWPLEFDPVWLESCEGFTAKKVTEAK